ncbi:hypothetical protein C8T65DRAFT_694044 [Cerioporus squamosus]|nr:hypothetical protein C8T65DRAFT_694044 [Cerioporus squamosus]
MVVFLQYEPPTVTPPAPVQLEFIRLSKHYSNLNETTTAQQFFTLQDAEEIETTGKERRVFRATLQGWSGGSVQVVCKVARGKDWVARLEAEADVYQGTLNKLQSVVVPQKSILYALITVHQYGIYHHQFVPRHVLYDKASCRVTLVNFALADAHHECLYPGKMEEPIHFYARGYSKKDCNCEELMMACEKLEAWAPPESLRDNTWNGRMLGAKDIKSTAEALVKEVLKDDPSVDGAKLRREAQKTLKEFKDWLRSRINHNHEHTSLKNECIIVHQRL